MPDTDGTSGFLLAEYGTLRDEILKRSEIQHQLLSFSLAAFGALIAVGVKDAPSALLAYPILVLFLAVGWTYNDLQIAQIGMYIKYRIEPQLMTSGGGWQHTLLSQRASREIGSLIKFATRGMFWGTEILAICLYLVKTLAGHAANFTEFTAENALLAISVAATAFTMWTMRNRDATVDEIEQTMRHSMPPHSRP